MRLQTIACPVRDEPLDVTAVLGPIIADEVTVDVQLADTAVSHLRSHENAS